MDFLTHYGTKRHSGRYPWGSGGNPEQRARSFLGYVKELQANGFSEKEAAEGMGITINQLRQYRSRASNEVRAANSAQAFRLKEKGMSTSAVAVRMGVNESTVRSWLKPSEAVKTRAIDQTANELRLSVDSKKYIDIGAGAEVYLGVSRTKLKTAVSMLEDEGYHKYYIQTTQLGTGKKTTIMTLAKPEFDYATVSKDRANISIVGAHSPDGGLTFKAIEPPRAVSAKRVGIRYKEDGGEDKDGVIELRRGVEDISLGKARYAQVRISVDGTHYMKGMAVYSDDLPDGVDMLFNTNKSKGTPKMEVLKPIKNDTQNPFGATIKLDDELILAQRHYIGADGKEYLSALNIVNEEGNWASWSKNLSAQMLSKQNVELIQGQIDKSVALKRAELDDILELTNPVIQKKLLGDFADGADAAAVHLKAAALPRQTSAVLLPFPDIKANEVYAPNYRDGEQIALVRYPHGGVFEIPVLTVNNKYKSAKSTIGSARDAIGIPPNVARQLSGADFDGDTVIAAPTAGVKLKYSSPLKGLENFDPKESYPAYEGMPRMTAKGKQKQMGNVSNLITDMTIKGADENEIAAAVRHSMVVIDAEKHNLNYKQSAIDNNVKGLKTKYQGSATAGAATIVSRASSQARTPLRKEAGIDPVTGKKLYKETPETFVDKSGKTVVRTTKTTKMDLVDDAFELSSGTPVETIYATYANTLKGMANETRLIQNALPSIKRSPSAARVYAEEVNSLNAKLNIALRNAPLERKAQVLANELFAAKKAANPNMTEDEAKKEKGRALSLARIRTGAKKQEVFITDKEWEAIQMGAISNNKLVAIINNSDIDRLKSLATPRETPTMTDVQAAKARAMIANGYTQAQIADAIGISISTVAKI